MKHLRPLLLLATIVILGVLVVVFRPAAEETEEVEPDTVSETDLQMYIKVYEAMQDDHDLNIDEAIKPYHITLDDFRQIERRVQAQPRLVERVREVLLQNARAHSVFAETAPTPTPAQTPPAEPKPRHRKKK